MFVGLFVLVPMKNRELPLQSRLFTQVHATIKGRMRLNAPHSVPKPDKTEIPQRLART
ncbi:hypothetical protein BCL90_3541 [Pedobacter alluvionis]|uniref:Uncharacterized protein n=1 Tax=Pedobacter alluvionis TaxID=475253 RepID=A0A497XUI9_9SPHI|nr:hypothetical protein BCL90_3541 [Pedobacter alluvionis]